MKRFTYQAKNRQGKTMKGIVEAMEEKRAIAAIRERALVVISLKEITPNILSYLFSRTFERISLGELTTFTRQLSTMITTGLTISESLDILRRQTSLAMARVLEEVGQDVEGGRTLAEAMEKHPKVFSRVFTALVRAGEEAGVLDQILARLAENLEKQREFNSKVKGAMVYPAIVVTGMIGVAAIMMIFVFPKLMSLYEEFQAELPVPTLVIMAISNFFVAFWWLVLLVIGGLLLAFRRLRQNPAGRKKLDGLLLTLPIFGNLQKQVVLTEVMRTLGLLVGAGISIVEALQITAAAAGNVVYEEILGDASKQVEKGLSLANILGNYEEFPPIVPQMVSIGEETGKMDEVLTKLSRYFEQEAEQMVKGLTTAIEPVIMILLGIGVGFLIIAVILPIYNLTSQF